jgi:hypothetical protein
MRRRKGTRRSDIGPYDMRMIEAERVRNSDDKLDRPW